MSTAKLCYKIVVRINGLWESSRIANYYQIMMVTASLHLCAMIHDDPHIRIVDLLVSRPTLLEILLHKGCTTKQA